MTTAVVRYLWLIKHKESADTLSSLERMAGLKANFTPEDNVYTYMRNLMNSQRSLGAYYKYLSNTWCINKT